MLKADGIYVGSGVLISKKGDVLTAAHVVSSAMKQRVFELNGTKHDCTILSRNEPQDLAILRCSGLANRAYIRHVSSVSRGERVIAIGSPGIDNLLVTSGIVSSFDHERGKLLVDISAGPGMSGGPVFNMKGELVGIVQAILMRPPFIMVSANEQALKDTLRSVRNK